MKNNIKKLLGLEKPSNYKISKDTDISQATLSDYSTGKSDIKNMKLDHAIKLNNYYEVIIMTKELGINLDEITEAKDEFNSWSGNAVLWIDFEDGKVWTDVSETPTYNADSIYSIVGKDDTVDPNSKYSVDRLVKLANLKHTYYKNNESDLLINSLDVNDIK